MVTVTVNVEFYLKQFKISSRREPSQIRTVATSARCVLGENPGYGYFELFHKTNSTFSLFIKLTVLFIIYCMR